MENSKKKRRMTTNSDCPICLDTYTKPKVLPCGHTFCQSCLLGRPRDGDSLTCPHCRKQHNIPEDGIQQFPDNYALISMIGTSSHAPTSVCEACGENGDNEFCDHCQKDVCERCCLLHKSSMNKIKFEMDMIDKMFNSPARVKKMNKNCEKWQTSLDNIVRERAEMDKYLTKCIEVLESRRKAFNDCFDTLEKLHTIFLRCADLQASKLLGNKLCDDLMRSCTTCTNTRKFDDIKSSVSQLLELSQMMLAMEPDDSFTFVGNAITFTQLSSIGDVTLGGIPLEILVKPSSDVINEVTMVQACAGPSCVSPIDTSIIEARNVMAGDQSCHEDEHPAGVAAAACAVVPDTRRLQVNYMDKGDSITIIPARTVIGNCSFSYPTGVAYCSHTNTLLVADLGNKRIMRYDMDGRNGGHFVRPGDTGRGVYKPYDIAISRVSGRVFVTENHRILVFTRDGDYVTSIGSSGTDDGQFGELRGITCHNGCVLVCDQIKSRVTLVTEDGAYIRHIETGIISKPQYVAVGRDDTVYVTNYDDTFDRCHGNVLVYRWDGAPVRQLGYRDGVSTWPGGVTVDHQGYVCVAWRDFHRVDVYNPHGKLHTRFGRDGESPGELMGPLGLELLPDGRLVVVDSKNHRLVIF